GFGRARKISAIPPSAILRSSRYLPYGTATDNDPSHRTTVSWNRSTKTDRELHPNRSKLHEEAACEAAKVHRLFKQNPVAARSRLGSAAVSSTGAAPLSIAWCRLALGARIAG